MASIKDRIRKMVDRFLPPEPSDTTEKEARPIPQYDPFGGSTVGDAYYNFVESIEQDRRAKYRDYDTMDNERSEISRALDDHADLMTTTDGDVTPIEIVAKDKRIQTILDDMIKRTFLNARLWSIAREMVKFGDDFEEVVQDGQGTIVRIKGLPVEQMYRIEDKFGILTGFEQRDEQMRVIAKWEPWQIIHFRNDRPRSSKYGRGLLQSGRRVWRQLQLIEDGTVVTRLARAPMRYAYMVPGGDATPSEQMETIAAYKNLYQKKRLTQDPITGKVTHEPTALTPTEDIFITTSKESPADVKVLQGQGNIGDSSQLEYFRDMFLTKVEIPKGLLGLSRDISQLGANGLNEADRHLCRKVNRRRGQLAAGVRQACDLELAVNGINPLAVEYQIKFPPLVGENAKVTADVEQIQAQTTTAVAALGVPLEFSLKRFLKLTEEEYAEIEKEIAEQTKRDQEMAAAQHDAQVKQAQAGAATAQQTIENPAPQDPKEEDRLFASPTILARLDEIRRVRNHSNGVH